MPVRREGILPARRQDRRILTAGDRSTPTQAAAFTGSEVTEIHVRARPGREEGDIQEQAARAYGRLASALDSCGASREHVVSEKILVSDLLTQPAPLRDAREDFYRGGTGVGAGAPATSIVLQPPLGGQGPFEIQAFALLPTAEGGVSSRGLEDLPAGLSGCIAEQGKIRLVCLSGFTGGRPGDGAAFEAQADDAFRRSLQILSGLGMSFRDVFRTWLYLRDIDADYGALNRARRRFFTAEGVQPPPASTGIRGGPHPPDRSLGLDLCALTGLPEGAVRPIHASSLNEAPEYGCDFSRGMRIEMPDRTIVHISGTASIDEHGEILHRGSVEGQVGRMLDNVKELLEGQGAGFSDLISLTTYLKEPGAFDAFCRVAAGRGLPERIPHTVCVADICRSDWLCEMEGIAVLAPSGISAPADA